MLSLLDFGNNVLHPSLFSASFVIGDECWSTADLSSKALWPHHWCSSQSTLATSARAHPIQGRRTDIQGTRHSATVPRTTRPSSRSARSADTPLCQLQSPGGADVPTVGSRAFNVSGPRIWNKLLEEVVSAPTFSSFRRRLKPSLFQQSYHNIVIQLYIWHYSGACGDVYLLSVKPLQKSLNWTELYRPIRIKPNIKQLFPKNTNEKSPRSRLYWPL